MLTNIIKGVDQRFSRSFLITTLATTLVSSVVVADTITVAPTLGPQFLELMARDQLIQSNNSEKTAIIWEVDGEAYCSHTPPAVIENGFQFAAPRWTSSGTNPGPLAQGLVART